MLKNAVKKNKNKGCLGLGFWISGSISVKIWKESANANPAPGIRIRAK